MKRRELLKQVAIALPLPSIAVTPLAAQAHGVKRGELELRHPHAYPNLPGMTTAAVYLVAIRNEGERSDHLLAASTTVADRVELHQMQMDADVMRMRALPGIEIPAKSTVSLRQGSTDGYHLMLFGLRRQLAMGDRFALTLLFERAGEIPVEVRVEAPRTPTQHSH